MFIFQKPQKTAKISNITIGGNPGENPVVMIGSLFYSGHKLVSDHQKGIFDKKAVIELIKKEEEISNETGLRNMIDVLGETVEALEKYINFVAEISDAPILLDSPNEKVRVEVLKRLDKELIPRIIYNSIDKNISQWEFEALAENEVKHVVFMAFNSSSIKPQERVRLLDETDVIKRLYDIGIENILIDTGVLDVPSISWSAKAVYLIKEKFGLPSGCAPSNAFYVWKKRRNLSDTFFKAAGSAALSLPLALGIDFVFYGPMINAKWAYPAVATSHALCSYNLLSENMKVGREIPLYKLF